MIASYKSSLLIVAGAIAFAGLGCASTAGPSVSMTHTSDAHVASAASDPVPEKTGRRAQLAALVRAEDDDVDDNPRGVLVIGDAILDTCSSVRAVHPKSDDAMAWLAIVKSVAHCMHDGELKSRNIVLHGPARPQVIVKYIFAKLGVPENRVEMSDSNGLACADDCDASEMRVEIGLAGGDSKDAKVAVSSLPPGM